MRGSSKTVLKKSRLLLILSIALLSLGIYGEALDLSRTEDAGVRCRFDFIDREELLAALNRGETVQLILSVRSASPRRYTLSSEGELSRLSRNARWDSIEQLYVVRRGNSKEYYLHKDAFLAAFLEFHPSDLDPSAGEYYFRGEVRWRELQPPMNILSPFLPDLYQRTGWIAFNPAEKE